MSQSTSAGALREVVSVVRGQATSDGAGVRLSRVIGQRALPDLDPFLMLDEFNSDDAADYIAGFPDHPHRGFETVTYMLAGRMRHGDDQGNTGLLTSGSVQWMTAGKGIVHSETPEQEEGLMRGFQLWVNLPAREKMTAPRYQDVPPQNIPQVDVNGAHVRVIAGRFGGAEGPVTAVATEPVYLDVHLDAGAAFEAPLPAGHNAFLYAYEGSPSVASAQRTRALERGELAVLGRGDAVAARAEHGAARFILVAGKPLGEPVARYGPIVMNTEAELHAAFEDLRAGRFSR